MAALTAITVTCGGCGEPLTVPVIMREVDRGRGGVHVRFDRDQIDEHRCPPDDNTPQEAAA